MGLGWREYAVPSSKVPVTLIITGSQEYGFTSSLQLQPINWMHAIKDVIGDRTLSYVVMPGSHDAGMDRIGSYKYGGSAQNTQTQVIDHYGQLKTGTRYFDMRFISLDGDMDNIVAAHLDDENKPPLLGASGAPLNDLIENLNRFMETYPGEVVIWSMRYMVNLITLTNDPPYSHPWDGSMSKAFYDTLKTIKNRCPHKLLKDGTLTFDQVPMEQLLNANNNQGCVMLIAHPQNELYNLSPVDDIFYGKDLNVIDQWAKKDLPSETMTTEVAALRALPRLDSSYKIFYIMQWKADTYFLGDVKLVDWYATNPALYHYGANNMSPDHFPTVILENTLGIYYYDKTSEDYYDTLLQNFAIGLNLYMVSQNCKISTASFPFDGKPQQSLSNFKGVVFFNGTVLDVAPPGFDRERIYV